MKTKKIWIYGVHSAMAALINPNRIIYEARCIDGMRDRIKKIRPDLKINIVDTHTLLKLTRGIHQGIALCCEPMKIEKNVSRDLLANEKKVLVLDQLQDVNNLGSIMRSMLAMNFTALITTQKNVPDLEQCSVKSASGAIEQLKLFQVANLTNSIKELKKQDFWCVGLDHRAKPISKSNCDKVALVIGSEGPGMRNFVSKECDELASLQTNADFPILNASVACAISMYMISFT